MTLFLGSLLISAFFFLCAYAIYHIALFITLRVFKREVVLSLKRAALLIILELAAFASLEFLHLTSYSWVFHLWVIIFILTIGYLFSSIVKAVYNHYMKKYKTEELDEIARRATMTQIHFIYNLLMFAIVVLTLAAILLTFPYVKSIGIGILGSAGIAGIALGIAARPILLNLMAGIQIALTKIVKIGDALVVNGDSIRVESIHLTHLIAKRSDGGNLIVPISYFIDHSFQNLSAHSAEIIGEVQLYCDYSIPVDKLREKFSFFLQEAPQFNGKVGALQVIDCTDKIMQIQLRMSAKDVSSATDLRLFIREKMIDFIQREYPLALPKVRIFSEKT